MAQLFSFDAKTKTKKWGKYMFEFQIWDDSMMQGQSGVQTLDKVVECFVFCVWNLNQVPLLSHNQMEKGDLTYNSCHANLAESSRIF